MTFHVPDEYRVRKGPYASTREEHGENGAFFIPNRGGPPLKIIASNGEGWEHVSVSLPHRCPFWEEMCRIKSIFWDPEDVVMQLHPPRSEWVNNHKYCLHMWRSTKTPIPTPPQWMVGYPELRTLP